MRYWQLRLASTFIMIAHNFLPGVLLSAKRQLTGNPKQYGVI